MTKSDIFIGLQFLSNEELAQVVQRCNEIANRRRLLASVSEEVEAATETQIESSFIED